MFQQGLKGVVAVQTAIASVDGDLGELRYRGQLVESLIEGRSFEETAYFLWHGQWPDAEQLKQLQQQLAAHRKLPAHIADIAQLLPKETSLMDAMRTLVSAYSHNEFQALSPAEQAIALTAALPVMTASFYRIQNGQEPIAPRSDLGHTANYLWMINGQEPTGAQTEALETYLKLTMEMVTRAAKVEAFMPCSMVSFK